MSNIAIVGSTATLSGFLLDELKSNPYPGNVLEISRGISGTIFLDLRYPDKFDYSILKKDDYIIFIAAISSPDICAREYELCWSINVVGTSFFIRRALEIGCHVLFFSSDAVFSGNTELFYTENTITIASTPYGKMKKMIEDEFCSNQLFKAMRLSYVVSDKDTFITYCIKCMKKDIVAEVFHPLYRNCISVKDLVQSVMWFINNWDTYKYSFLNIAGTELVSRIRMADELNRFFKKKLEYTVVTPNGEFYSNRPSITQMKSIYLFDYEIIDDVSFSEKMQDVMKRVKL